MSKVKLFIKHAEVLRHGGMAFAIGPRSFGLKKVRRHYGERMEEAYVAILQFNRKHPDSTRTRKAKRVAVEMKQVRQMKERAA